MRNILFSTTRSWNPGDDFILFGIRNLLEDHGIAFNSVIYNRNPDFHYPRMKGGMLKLQHNGQVQDLDIRSYMAEITWRSDNSWRPGMPMDFIDYAIFAGTPEWLGDMNLPMSQAILKNKIPVSYIGIGAFENIHLLDSSKFYAEDKQLLERAECIIVRDNKAENLLSALSPVCLPCPSIFSARKEREITKVKKLAINIQHPKARQPINDYDLYEYLRELIEKLSKKYDCTLVAHYIDELSYLQELNLPILYSYDPVDYFDIYYEFDYLLTTRVHACGVCASMGIPATFFTHTDRASTVDGFLSRKVNYKEQDVETTLAQLSDIQIKEENNRLRKHKQDCKQKYRDALSEVSLFTV